ncbi:MAG: CoA-binding protein [Halanaerobium sp.]
MSLIEKTMKMKNWAVVGATTKENRYGYKIVKKLKENDYNVFPVNPKFEKVEGLKCYDDLSSIETQIDVVDMVINPKHGINVMKEINDLGIKHVWLQPGTRSQEIRDFAAKNNIEIVEDCIYARL